MSYETKTVKLAKSGRPQAHDGMFTQRARNRSATVSFSVVGAAPCTIDVSCGVTLSDGTFIRAPGRTGPSLNCLNHHRLSSSATDKHRQYVVPNTQCARRRIPGAWATPVAYGEPWRAGSARRLGCHPDSSSPTIHIESTAATGPHSALSNNGGRTDARKEQG